VVVVDRGFRDAVDVMECLGLDVAMPPFLDNRRQLSSDESNQSRWITKVRWIVETVNRRIKKFKYFANTAQNSSLVYLQADLSVICALINRFKTVIATSNPSDVGVGIDMRSLINQKHVFQTVSAIESQYSELHDILL
jgi:hypothetical protein